MKRCNICHRFFKLKAENKYLVFTNPTNVFKKVTVYEAFDCPWCGCQNLVGIREIRMDEVEE